MLSIRLLDVPTYLHKGDFFKSLDKDGDDIIMVPSKCFKTTTTVENSDDLSHLISTLTFWGSDILSTDLVRYAMTLPEVEFRSISNSDHCSWPFLIFLGALRKVIASSTGKISTKELLRCRFRNWDNDSDIVSSVVRFCCVQFEAEDGQIWNTRTCQMAAEFGAFKILMFLHEHGCPWNEQTCKGAAAARCLDCLQYAREKGCPWNADTCAAAAEHNSLGCLRYAYENGCPWDERACLITSPSCFAYARDNCCPAGVLTCADAAAHGDFVKLQSAHESGYPWDKTTCEWAARRGSLECLEYALDHGCPCDRHSLCDFAVSDIQCLQYVHNRVRGYITGTTCSRAAAMGNLITLTYAHQHSTNGWDKRTCEQAAVRGALNCLVYAHQQCCYWDSATCACAAEEGNLDCLIYAHERGCPWDSETCTGAAAGGHLRCLMYAHAHGCPWDSAATWRAAQGGHQDCFQYALLNGCPLERIMYHFLRDRVRPQRCLLYAQQLEELAVRCMAELQVIAPGAVVVFSLVRVYSTAAATAAIARGLPGYEKLPFGTSVKADYQQNGLYFPGRVVLVHTDGTVDIEYGDGQREQRVAAACLRSISAGTAEAERMHPGPLRQYRPSAPAHVVVGAMMHYPLGEKIAVVEAESPYQRGVKRVPPTVLGKSATYHLLERARDPPEPVRPPASPSAADAAAGTANDAANGDTGTNAVVTVHKDNDDVDKDDGYFYRIDPFAGSSIRIIINTMASGRHSGDSRHQEGSYTDDDYNNMEESKASRWDVRGTTAGFSAAVGLPVEGNYRAVGVWHAGRVTQVHRDGSIDIAYHNGWRENRVPLHSVRLPGSSRPFVPCSKPVPIQEMDTAGTGEGEKNKQKKDRWSFESAEVEAADADCYFYDSDSVIPDLEMMTDCDDEGEQEQENEEQLQSRGQENTLLGGEEGPGADMEVDASVTGAASVLVLTQDSAEQQDIFFLPGFSDAVEENVPTPPQMGEFKFAGPKVELSPPPPPPPLSSSPPPSQFPSPPAPPPHMRRHSLPTHRIQELAIEQQHLAGAYLYEHDYSSDECEVEDSSADSGGGDSGGDSDGAATVRTSPVTHLRRKSLHKLSREFWTPYLDGDAKNMKKSKKKSSKKQRQAARRRRAQQLLDGAPLLSTTTTRALASSATHTLNASSPEAIADNENVTPMLSMPPFVNSVVAVAATLTDDATAAEATAGQRTGKKTKHRRKRSAAGASFPPPPPTQSVLIHSIQALAMQQQSLARAHISSDKSYTGEGGGGGGGGGGNSGGDDSDGAATVRTSPVTHHSRKSLQLLRRASLLPYK